MDEFIELPVVYKGEELMIKAGIRSFGYTYKLSVEIDGIEVFFERDEQQNYRAVLADAASRKQPDAGMIRAILLTLEELK